MSSSSLEPPNIKATAPKKLPSLWRNRDYLLLWSGQAISSVGSNISGFAYPLLALFLTGSPALAGLVATLYTLPYLFLSLPVGALIDRWDRKRVMILCDTGRALALGSIPVAVVLGHLTMAQLYVTALIEGSLFVFFNIAEVACLPRVVTKEQLPAANGQNQASFIIANLVGSPLAGVIYSLSRVLPFLADSISYAFSVVSLFFIRTPFQGERTAARRKLRAEIAEGVRWLWNQPLFFFLAFITGGMNFIFSGLALVLIVIAQRQGATPPIIGLIFTIGAVGGVLGSLVAAPIQKRFRFGTVIITAGWVNALFWPLYAVAPNPFLLGAVTGVLFSVGPVFNVVVLSYRLAIIPDALQGRVNSSVRMISYGFQPLGAALAGVLLQWLGPVRTVLVLGAVQIVLAVATTLNTHVRHARPLAEVAGGQ